MPTIVGNPTAIQTELNTGSQIPANYYRFTGIRFIPSPSTFTTNLIRIGDGNNPETTLSMLPHHIVFDRVIISGDPIKGGRRGILMNGRMTGVVDSYINDWKQSGADTQAIGGWNGAEGYKIVNNYLEAATENVFFGGATSSIYGINPSDIEIRNNYFYKPPAWIGSQWLVKNLFELKTGERVLVEGNVMDGSWAGAQSGKAINLKSTNQAGTAAGGTWYHTGDVTVRNNIIRNMGAVASLSAIYPGPAVAMNNIEFSNNVIEKINVPPYISDPNSGYLFYIGYSGASIPNLTIRHNTIVTTGSLNYTISLDQGAATNVVISDNILSNGTYGVKAGGYAARDASLGAAFSNYSFNNNAIIGGTATLGKNTILLTSIASASVNFTDLANGNYQITGGPLKNAATDGTDIGANINLVNQFTSGVISGRPGNGSYVPPISSIPPALVSLPIPAIPVIAPAIPVVVTPQNPVLTTPNTSAPTTGAGLGAGAGSNGNSENPTKTLVPPVKVPKISRNLTVGSRGNDVKSLQIFLVKENKGPIAKSLASRGTTSYFGPLTKKALAEYQAKVGINPATGNLGPLTREYLRKLK